MHILCLGLNHTTTPLDLREKLAFSEESARSALARLGCGDCLVHIFEMVILSTCNRIELYLTSEKPDFNEIESFLSDAHGMPVSDFHAHLYRLSDEEVVDHLYRVTTGLDSLVLGEPQILGQVTRSLELALGVGACGTVLSRLFRSAIHAGKRARTETAISRNPASVSSLAASLAAREVKNLPAGQVVVVGAGEMAELAVEALRKRGAAQIVVVNRTLERAQSLANRWQAEASTFEHLESLLLEADIVISSTSAPHTIIHAPHMVEIMVQRSHRSMVMVDIAVPRDIDPQVGQIPGVRLYDLDSLDQQVKNLLAERAAEVPQVEAILAEEKARFLEYLSTLDMLPLITELRKQAEAIRYHELERTLHRLPGLTEAERQRIDAMTRSLVKKLLDTPTQRLRIEATCPHASEYATVARTLFDLPGEQGLCAFSNKGCSTTSPSAAARQPIPQQSIVSFRIYATYFATRPSALARRQTQWVIQALQKAAPGLTCEQAIITTQGDKILNKPLPEIGGKGLFTQELESELLSGAVHCAVHSLKDLPIEQPAGLTIGCIPPRADARDVLVSAKQVTLASLPLAPGASSAAQLKRWPPDPTWLSNRCEECGYPLAKGVGRAV
jgi:glutamyl-tRNA reductase